MEVTTIRPQKGKPLEILSVEDSAADQKLIAEILKESENPINLTFVYDGTEALSYLKREGAYSQVSRPDLILLDLSLPKKDGYEVLKEVRELEGFREIPILILTTSDSEDDRLRCRKLLANSYLTKHSDLDRFSLILKAVDRFCEAQETKKRLALDEDSLRAALREEREARKSEREELKKRISILESRIAAHAAQIKRLENIVANDEDLPD